MRREIGHRRKSKDARRYGSHAVAQDGIDDNEYRWAAEPLEAWAEFFGCSTKIIERYFSKPPFYSEKAYIKGRRDKLVRILDPGEEPRKTLRRVANELRRVWAGRKIDYASIAKAVEAGKPWRTQGLLEGHKVKVSPNEHGCLIGLAAAWRDGHSGSSAS